jgi:hypothetical protein
VSPVAEGAGEPLVVVAVQLRRQFSRPCADAANERWAADAISSFSPAKAPVAAAAPASPPRSPAVRCRHTHWR